LGCIKNLYLPSIAKRNLSARADKAQLGKLNGQKRWLEDSESLQQGREDKNVFTRLWKSLRNLPNDTSSSSNSRSIFDRLKIPKALPDLKDRTK